MYLTGRPIKGASERPAGAAIAQHPGRDAKLLQIMDGTNETLMLKVAALL